MEITDELITHLENLSKLKLTDEEIQKMKVDMAALLEYMKMLDEVDVKGYDPLFTMVEDPMELRKDIAEVTDPSKIFEQFPQKKDNLVSVPSLYSK